MWDSPEPSLLQAEQLHLSQPRAFQLRSLKHLCGPSLHPLQYVHDFSSHILKHADAVPERLILCPLACFQQCCHLSVYTYAGCFPVMTFWATIFWVTLQSLSWFKYSHGCRFAPLILIVASEIFIRITHYCFHFLMIQRLWFSLARIFCAALAEWSHVVRVSVMTKECSWILFFIPCKSSVN